MSEDAQSLFRQEVLQAKSDTAAGAPLQIQPVRAGALTAFFAVLALSAIGVLVFGSYTKKERVQGVLQPEGGVAQILPPEAGVVRQVRVKEGQAVKAGELIAEISQDRFSDAGNTQALIESSLNQQRTQVQEQAEGQNAALQATLAALDQRIAQGRRDLIATQEEMRLQEQQIASASKLLKQLQPLAEEKIISDLQYEQQRQALLDQTARLQALKRQKSATEGDLAQAQDERQKQAAQHRVTRAGLDRDLLNLQQEQLQRRSARVTWLKAPFDGTISGLLATPGQSVGPSNVITSVVPAASKLEAVLYVPSTAMGFIKAGQHVRISYDAFPYQRFGQYEGTVRSVSQTDVPVQSSNGQDRRAVFLVRVALSTDRIQAYGTDIALRPGHSLTADIELDRRRLYRWMLDPLFAFSGKL
jgi:membrane fusion protein